MRATRWAVIIAVVVAAGCGTATDSGTAGSPARKAPVVYGAPHATDTTAPPPPTTAPAPAKTTVATAVVEAVNAYDSPSAAASVIGSFSNPNEMGVPLVFLVKAAQPEWLEVMLPTRPNGVTGWIRAADVSLSESEWRVRVELGEHRLTVWRGNDVVVETPVAVGTSSAPTPTGDFYLTEVLETGNPGGAYGPYAFGLSAFSDVYTEFAGGPGQIGLHGTNAPSLLGTDASHGCIRVDNATITKLAAELPPGSPISVTG